MTVFLFLFCRTAIINACGGLQIISLRVIIEREKSFGKSPKPTILCPVHPCCTPKIDEQQLHWPKTPVCRWKNIISNNIDIGLHRVFYTPPRLYRRQVHRDTRSRERRTGLCHARVLLDEFKRATRVKQNVVGSVLAHACGRVVHKENGRGWKK